MEQEDAVLLVKNAIPATKNQQKLAKQKTAAALLKRNLFNNFLTYPRLSWIGSLSNCFHSRIFPEERN